MSTSVNQRQQRLPSWGRHVLVVLLVGGVLAMHTLLMGLGHGSSMNHGEMASTVAGGVEHAGHAVIDAATDITAPMPDGGGGGGGGGMMDDCGGLAALCLAMVVGVSAYLWVSRRHSSRVLWQLPPPLLLLPASWPRPMNSQSPRERTCLLRC